MTYAVFRNGRKVHTKRPKACEKSARWAWDKLSEHGTIVTMLLIDGDWFAERENGDLDTVENITARYETHYKIVTK